MGEEGASEGELREEAGGDELELGEEGDMGEVGGEGMGKIEGKETP